MPSKRLLIVSPHFPPVNAPDHQRVRMMLPHLQEAGWDAHVLAFRPEVVEAARDPDLLFTVPAEVPVTHVNAIPSRYTRPFGVGNLVWRGGRAFRRAAVELVRTHRFDLAFFSTTVFGTLPLGPYLRRRFGLPYVVDFQDPWVSDYYHTSGVRPPGGWLRYGLSSWKARRAEPAVVRQAAHVITVSPAYPENLMARYPDVPRERFTVVPFAASRRDFEVVRERNIRQPVFDPADGKRHWVYLGRGGRDMAKALRGLFGALRELRPTEPEVGRLRLHFVGTSYAPAGLAEETILPVARECGVADLVEERTGRIPYLQGLALLQAADTILVVGSDDPSYSASKVYNCVAAGRPILALLHEKSAAGQVIVECGAGVVIRFLTSNPKADSRIDSILQNLISVSRRKDSFVDETTFEPYTSRFMTDRLCNIFNEILLQH